MVSAESASGRECRRIDLLYQGINLIASDRTQTHNPSVPETDVDLRADTAFRVVYPTEINPFSKETGAEDWLRPGA